MRPEISNELLLQVIQAWDPAEAGDWFVDDERELRWGENQWYIRWPEGRIYSYYEASSYYKASKLVEFLLKDRPDLNSEMEDIWDSEMLSDCRKEFGTSWAINPWTTDLDTPGPADIVRRIKAYEYLKAWKESQEPNWKEPETYEQYCDWCRQKPDCVPLSLEKWSEACKTEATVTVKRTIPIDPGDVTLSVGGQIIERMEIRDDVLEIPTTYEKICPHCNGSKEVVGWRGKESCQACT